MRSACGVRVGGGANEPTFMSRARGLHLVCTPLGRMSLQVACVYLCLELLASSGTSATMSRLHVHVSTTHGAAADGSAANPTSLEHALRLAAAARDPVTVEMQAGIYTLREPLRIPSNTTLRRSTNASSVKLSGGVRINGWVPEAGRDWLYRAPLPDLLRGGALTQLFVAGQRRGAARSPTMRFASVTAVGLRAGPQQLLAEYSNASAMRCMMYQHWTASYRKVVAVDAVSGNITLDKPPPGGTVQPTGDLGSGSRYVLENAPEYLAPRSGTFFADSTTILYSPLEAESQFFNQLEIVAAIPGLFELVSPPANGSSSGVALENLEFSHTDVDFATCFASDCDDQAVSSQTTAALHFEFADRVSLSNVTIEHVGGYALWFGAGVRNSRFSGGRILDMGAGGIRIGEAVSFENHTENRTVRNVIVEDSVLHDGGNVFRAGMGVLLQAAADCTITHNEVSMFRQTGISLGWRWNYGPTSDGNNTVSYNNISTIGMGETSDLGCVYHLGEDLGTVIHGNLCYNVSSFDYGAIAYYLDQSSRYVTVSNNVAYDVKCVSSVQCFRAQRRCCWDYW